MSIRVESDMHRRRRSQNIGVAVCSGFVYRSGHGVEPGQDHQLGPCGRL